MKKIVILCAITALILTGLIWRAIAKPTRFGAFTAAPRTEVARLIAEPQAFLGKTVTIRGNISEQCKSMGCYFFFHSGKDTLRIDIQEVAMTAPMKEGRPARVEGQLVPYNGGYQFYASAVEFE
jgi:hypothetical protein